jgi:hypothetical protein
VEADRITDFQEVLPRNHSRGHSSVPYWAGWDPGRGGQVTSEITESDERAAGNVRRATTFRHAERSRLLKSWHQISLPLISELGRLELSLLLALVFTANVIVATIAWFVVGSLLR